MCDAGVVETMEGEWGLPMPWGRQVSTSDRLTVFLCLCLHV